MRPSRVNAALAPIEPSTPHPRAGKLTFCFVILPYVRLWANPRPGWRSCHAFVQSVDMVMSDSPLAVIFDLDGTLVDTAPDLLGALNAVLVAEGHEPVVPKDLRKIVGHGARA